MSSEPPKLLDRVRSAIRARHYSRRTEEAYVYWIRRHILFHGKRHPRELGSADVTAFLTSMAVKDQVAASTQNQALSGVLFLYREVLRQDPGVIAEVPRARTPHHVPVVLSVADVRRVLEVITGVPRLVASLLYGAGRRLQECLSLRVKDLDFQRREITVRRGKGAEGPARHVAGRPEGAAASSLRPGEAAARIGFGSRLWPRRAARCLGAQIPVGADGVAMAVRISGGSNLPERTVGTTLALSHPRVGDSAGGDDGGS